MSKPLTSAELKIIAILLKESSEEYSNHGCNDYDLPNTEENKTMLVEMIKSSFDEEEQEEMIENIMSSKKKLYTYDWVLMSYLSKRCKEAAK